MEINEITLSENGANLRVRASYPVDNSDGKIEIDVMIPNDAPTLLEVRARACELAAASLMQHAEMHRRELQAVRARMARPQPM